jgi:hypothetical protein
MGASALSGKSSGNQQTQAVLTPEQKDLLATQTNFLKNTALPAYTSTVQGAKDVLGNVMPAVQQAAGQASDVASGIGALSGAVGGNALLTGTQGLQSLFNPQYEQNQINAALQAGRESARESQAGQNAMYGGAGGLGSSRMVLADQNLASLNAQRQATAAAGAQAQVQANKAAAANQLANIGGQGLSSALSAAASRVGLAGAPQDIYNKYASVVYGIPQANTTANFTGTQGSNQQGQSQSKGFGVSK